MRIERSRMIKAAGGFWAAVLYMVGACHAQQYNWSTFTGNTNGPGFSDGTGAAARFQYPRGMGADSSGNLYIADTNNHTIRKITPAGVATTLAGSPLVAGSTDGTGAAARFSYPQCLAVGPDGSIYVTQNHMVRKVTPAGVVTTLAGSSATGSTNATGTAARFNGPFGVAVDPSGNIYVADSGNQTIRKITSAGVVTTLAGAVGSFGSTDGTGGAARFSNPMGLATDAAGNVYVADSNNQTIRKITPAGVVTTIAGTVGQSGTVDGSLTTARLNYPEHLVSDPSGNLYVVEYAAVRKVTQSGDVTTLAGSSLGGRANGAGTVARFSSPYGITRDAAGNLFVVDSDNHSIRRISTDLMVTTFAGGFTESGSTDGVGTDARFYSPFGGTTDSGGNLFIAEFGNHTIRKITSAASASNFAGTAGSSGSANGTGSAARFNNPVGVVSGPAGILYVADSGNHTIRKITSTGVVNTFAGSPGLTGWANGTSTAARFNQPQGLAIDSSGNVYVADYGNHIIRKITSAGSVTTLAGTAGSAGSTNGNGAAARFNFPFGIAVDASGNVFVSDWGNHTIRKITSTGDVTTLAGTALTSGSADGTGSAARMNRPCGLTLDSTGNLYIADRFNHTIRKLTSAGVMTTVGGLAAENGLIADGVGSAARFRNPAAVWVDAADNLYVADSSNERIVKGVPAVPEIVIEQPSGTGLTSGGTITCGILAIGSTSAKTFTVRNTGTVALALTSVSVTGGNTGDFPVNITGMLTSIPAGGFTTFSVSFTPAAAGNRGTTLRLLSNDSDEATFDIALSGTGNTPPVFSGYSASTAFQTPASLSIVKLLRKATDADGDAVTLTSAGPPSLNGGSAVINAGSLVYTPPGGFSGNDSFAITLTDARGASIPATVTVSVAAAVAAGQGNIAVNPPRLNVMPGGAIGVRFQGIPGRNYRIDRSTDLASWQALVTVTAGATGEVSYTDPAPPQPSAYYRLALP